MIYSQYVDRLWKDIHSRTKHKNAIFGHIHKLSTLYIHNFHSFYVCGILEIVNTILGGVYHESNYRRTLGPAE